MGRKADYYKKALKTLEEIHKKYPQFELGRNISTAFSDYGDLWGVSGKEFCYALERYLTELDMDVLNIAPEEYVDGIVEDGKHLFDEERDEDDYEEEEYENV